jgi:hypothetical protein
MKVAEQDGTTMCYVYLVREQVRQLRLTDVRAFFANHCPGYEDRWAHFRASIKCRRDEHLEKDSVRAVYDFISFRWESVRNPAGGLQFQTDLASGPIATLQVIGTTDHVTEVCAH